MFNTKKGFTLIELLIVIGIIGILSGILFAVINPAAQRTKALQSVIRSNTEKACLAKAACLSGDQGGLEANCDTIAEIGINAVAGNPAGSTYDLTGAGTVVGSDGAATPCTYTCTVASGAITAGAACITK
ncbi:prepilin-type N-terminal cleavage/methylation domain-containing protein [Patescibacteria group bacterium]|nr:prepilin-type N-terminal cleavage/methylation domain-containing protein [Patescibacteria group bacterium]